MKAVLTERVSDEDEHEPHEAQLTVVPSHVGRPIVHTEPWAKVTIVMEESHVLFLDLVILCIRATHQKHVSRAELIRALVEFMEKSGIDFTQFRNADEITEGVVAYLKGIALRGRLPLLDSALFDSARAARARRVKPRRAIDVSPSIEEKI